MTSARRANTSIPIATSARTGSMKSETAAPVPSEPPSIPVLKAQVVRTSVLAFPFVRM
jgi:hypothetical protein